MPAYTILNTAGATVATIGVATTTGASFPIELIGQGISLYGPQIATSQYRMLENFTRNIPPANPVQGMLWYNNDLDQMNYYDGVQFVPFGSPTTNASSGFSMLPSATNINLAVNGTTSLFTAPGVSDQYHATSLLLKVNGVPTATGPAILNLFVSTPEDVLENVNVSLPSADVHGFYLIQGTTRVAPTGSTINLQVVAPATGGSLRVDAYLFGFKT
jgi:hypothetical protein